MVKMQEWEENKQVITDGVGEVVLLVNASLDNLEENAIPLLFAWLAVNWKNIIKNGEKLINIFQLNRKSSDFPSPLLYIRMKILKWNLFFSFENTSPL